MKIEIAKEYLVYFVDEIIVVRTCHEMILGYADVAKTNVLWEKYNYFFSHLLRGSFIQLLLSLSRFYDQQKDSRKFSTLVNATHDENLLKEYTRLLGVWEMDYKRFRDEELAHLDKSAKKQTPESMVAMSIINPKHLTSPQFKKFCDDTHNLLSSVYDFFHMKSEKHNWQPFFQARTELNDICKILEAEVTGNKS